MRGSRVGASRVRGRKEGRHSSCSGGVSCFSRGYRHCCSCRVNESKGSSSSNTTSSISSSSSSSSAVVKYNQKEKTRKKSVLFRAKHTLVAFSDPGIMKMINVLGQSPRNWKTTKQQNTVPKFFHTQNIFHHAWKIVKTTLQYIVVLQSRREGHRKKKKTM